MVIVSMMMVMVVMIDGGVQDDGDGGDTGNDDGDGGDD